MFVINIISLIIVILGSINTGIMGAFNYNVLSAILGGETSGDYNLSIRIIFCIIGIAGIWIISFLDKPGILSGKACCCKKKLNNNNKR